MQSDPPHQRGGSLSQSAGPVRLAVAQTFVPEDPTDPGALRESGAQAYAALHSYWVGYSCAAQHSRTAQAGIIAPGGRWLARCPADGQPALAIADLDPDSPDEDIVIARRYARPWRRTARHGLYEFRTARTDPRSTDHASF